MPRHPHPTATFAALALCAVACAQAQDFYIPPPSTVDSHVLNLSRENLRHQRETDTRLRNSRSTRNVPTGRPGVAASPDDVMLRVERTSLTALAPEYQRRAAAYGEASARQWLNTAARSVGAEMGRLGPEYLHRAQAQGRVQADGWYVAQARHASQRQVAGRH